MKIFGVHACQVAFESGKHEIRRVYVQEGRGVPEWLKGFPKSKITYWSLIQFKEAFPKDSVAQGIAMEIDDAIYSDIEDLADAPKNCVVAILDNVTDPHNFGAIIRTAAAFGINGIIISDKGSCKVNGTVAKAACGGLDHTAIYVVKNLAQAIRKLKDYGFWIVSFCERGEKTINEVDLTGRTCLILGSEGDGIRRLQKEASDFVVKLPTAPEFPTLNVSVSAGIAFYEAAKQNNFKL
jgi:23S rRNA (guanosine2251-2'-O)-methyltransferase